MLFVKTSFQQAWWLCNQNRPDTAKTNAEHTAAWMGLGRSKKSGISIFEQWSGIEKSTWISRNSKDNVESIQKAEAENFLMGHLMSALWQLRP